MRFGISATSLMCPKNLRTRLRPVNVCCAIVASRYRRPFEGGEPSKARLPPPPGFEFSSVLGSEAQFQGTQVLNLFFRPSERKTTREALDRTRPSDRSHCGLQKPEIACSPNDLRRIRRRPPPKPCFRAAAPIWGSNRGDSRVKFSNPHKFPCSTYTRASLLQVALSKSPLNRLQKAGKSAKRVFTL